MMPGSKKGARQRIIRNWIIAIVSGMTMAAIIGYLMWLYGRL